MTYKSERSKKRYYFRSFCRFSSLVRRESQASMIPSTIMTSSRHSIFAQTSLSLAESDLPSAGFQKFGIQHHAAWLPMQEFYTVTVYEDIHVAVAGVLPHGVCDDTAEGMEAFAHISRTVIQQIAHTVIKAEHGCRPG